MGNQPPQQRFLRRKVAEEVAEELGITVDQVIHRERNGLRGNLKGLVAHKAEIVRQPQGVIEELQLALARTLALEELLERKVEELTDGDWKDRVGQRVLPRIELYERALERASRVLGDYVRLQVEVRKASLDEQQAMLVVEVLRKIVDDPELGLDESQRRRALTAAAHQLRVLDAGAA